MNKCYIINGVIEFHPAASILRDINNPNKVEVLNSPAARCFFLLIERKGDIVTQQEFIDIIWLSRGMQVSPNTYYQNISILRKGLKNIGFNTDVIVTIPRIGLTLANDIKIVIKETQDKTNESNDNNLLPDKEVIGTLPPPPLAPALDNSRSRVVVLCSLLLIAGVSIVNNGLIHGNKMEDHYRFTTIIGQCRIFMTNNIQTKSEEVNAISYAEKFKSECGEFPWIYIAKYMMLPRTSVIRCNRPWNEHNRCISDYFIEER